MLIAVPLIFLDGSSAVSSHFNDPHFQSSSNPVPTGLIIFVVIAGLMFSGLAICLIVSAVRRPRKIVFSVDQRALLMEYGCKAPEVRKINIDVYSKKLDIYF